ncbi:sigma-70 family RNA polymerase sigma factor [Chamaesiphon sp. VAR_48_metabat_403]|uniref:sigma-70 family RNA polymerase sigma factor n=1 Tax=Chamaesiphon sp. VAR_48_metabat_403 TaxID=2964700 RepID=UPI00286EA841|nr:sigma-70 family RNA polymerase sigma factor [Chamaesiphon sp. VAR_48_metabat_403]
MLSQVFSGSYKPMLVDESDLQVLTALRQGDTSALGIVYDRYGAAVYRLALRMLANPTEAEDLTQEVFLAFWRGVDKYDPDRGTLLVFLLTITRSRALNRFKQQGSQQNLQQRVGNYLPRTNSNPGMEAVTLTELRERMGAALQAIPTAQKQVLEMGYYQGKSQSEIAQELDLPIGTVKTRSRQGLLKLRQFLQDLVE